MEFITTKGKADKPAFPLEMFLQLTIFLYNVDHKAVFTMSLKLSLQVCKFLKHGVGNRYDTAVGLEASLGGDHIGKLGGQIHV